MLLSRVSLQPQSQGRLGNSIPPTGQMVPLRELSSLLFLTRVCLEFQSVPSEAEGEAPVIQHREYQVKPLSSALSKSFPAHLSTALSLHRLSHPPQARNR